MSDNITFEEQYTVICLNFDYTYSERIFNDVASMQSFINELKQSDKLIDRIFVSSRITSYGLVEVL